MNKETGIQEQIFHAIKKSIITNLKERIKADIKVFLSNDSIFIDIYGNHQTYFRYIEYDFSEKALNSITGQAIADKCYKQYKKNIFNEFFIKKDLTNFY